jgi:hypothetical protein
MPPGPFVGDVVDASSSTSSNTNIFLWSRKPGPTPTRCLKEENDSRRRQCLTCKLGLGIPQDGSGRERELHHRRLQQGYDTYGRRRKWLQAPLDPSLTNSPTHTPWSRLTCPPTTPTINRFVTRRKAHAIRPRHWGQSTSTLGHHRARLAALRLSLSNHTEERLDVLLLKIGQNLWGSTDLAKRHQRNAAPVYSVSFARRIIWQRIWDREARGKGH